MKVTKSDIDKARQNKNAMDDFISANENLILYVIKDKKFFIESGDFDDMLQLGRVALYKAVQSFDETKNINFENYAKKLIERTFINEIKNAHSNKNLALNTKIPLNNQGEIVINEDNEEDLLIPLNSNIISPEDQYINNETASAIISKISPLLSKFEYEILSLKINGYSYVEIAKLLNKSSKSIDNALNRIKNKLTVLKEWKK